MKILLFYHSLLSDWNHGNAHFLRGIATELCARGHVVEIWEPRNSWSAKNLVAEHGLAPVREFHRTYPRLRVRRYHPASLCLDRVLEGADLVLVHEWNDPGLVEAIGRHRAGAGSYVLLFHDTHHRMVTDPASMRRYILQDYDGVLAYGRVLRDLYLAGGKVQRAWTWHEAADTRVFHPCPQQTREGDLVWIGNWGDDERAAELREFLLDPCRELGLRARVYGVRYPAEALHALNGANISYGGWLANFRVPEVFSKYRVTVHVPRRPYVRTLPGIPTIRPFEALACGIPLISSPWSDVEHLFRPGEDFLLARNGAEMTGMLRDVLHDEGLARRLAANGLNTIRLRHTCSHRVDELLAICRSLRGDRGSTPALKVGRGCLADPITRERPVEDPQELVPHSERENGDSPELVPPK